MVRKSMNPLKMMVMLVMIIAWLLTSPAIPAFYLEAKPGIARAVRLLRHLRYLFGLGWVRISVSTTLLSITTTTTTTVVVTTCR